MADDITLKVGMDPASLITALKQIEDQAKKTLSSLPVAGQQQRSTAANPIANPAGGVYAPGQFAGAISPEDAAAARRVAVESIGQQIGQAQFARANAGPATPADRRAIDTQYNALRAQGNAATGGDLDLVKALNAARQETLQSLRDEASGRAVVTKQTKDQLSLEQQAAEVQIANAKKADLKNETARQQRISNAANPILGPAYSGPTVEQQASAQISAGKERLAVEKEVTRQQLQQNDTLTRMQRLQLQTNTLFGRRNLEGLPPTGTELLAQSVGTIGRYAVAGAGVYALTSGIKAAVSEAANLQVVMGHLQVQLDTIGKGDQLKGLSNAIFGIAKETGTSISDVAGLASQFVGAFAGATGDVVAGATKATEVATKLSVLGGIKPGEVFNDLSASMKAFAEEGTSASYAQAVQSISDITVAVSEVSGVPIQQLADFLGRIAPIAKTAGLSLKETSAIGAALLQGSGTGGAALGQQFGGILTEFSKTAGPAIALLVQQVPQLRTALDPKSLSEFDAALANSDPTVLFGLAKGFQSLSLAQQQNIIQSLASRREGATLAALLQNSTTLVTAYAAAQNGGGRTQDEFTKRQQQFSQQLAQLKTTLLEIGVAILNSGFLKFATDLASILTDLVKPLAAVIGLFNKVPESVRTAAISIGVAATAFSLLSGRGGAAGGGSGSSLSVAQLIAQRNGTGVAASAAEGESGTFFAGLLASGRAGASGLARGAVPYLPAVGGLIAGNVIAGSGFGKTQAGGALAGAARGAGIGATVGLLGGPFDPISVPVGTALGATLGGLAGFFGNSKKSPAATDLSTVDQKTFDAARKKYQDAQKALAVPALTPTPDNEESGAFSKSIQAHDKAKRAIDSLNKQYPDLQSAIQNGVTLIADLPKNVADKINDTSQTLEQAISDFQAGSSTLGDVNRQFEINKKALSGLHSSDAAKQLADINKQQQKLNDAALKSASDYQEELANDTGTGTPEATVARLKTLLSRTTNKDDRAALGTDLLKAEKSVLDTQVSIAQAAGDTQKALALLRDGIPLDDTDRSVIIETQLNDYAGAFQTFLDGVVAVGIGLPSDIIATLTGVIASGGDAIATVKAILQDKLNGFILSAVSVLQATGNPSTTDATSIDNVQKQIDALKGIAANFGVSAPTRIKGSASDIAGAQKSADQTAKAISDARADLMKAYIENDPVALANFNIKDADRQASAATTEAERIQAQAAKVRAEHSLVDAINAVNESKFQLVEAIANAAGDTLGAAQAGVDLAQQQLTDLQNAGAGEAAINGAKANVVTAQASQRDAILQQGIDDNKFAVDIGTETNGQYVAYLKSLLDLPNLTKKQRQDIQLQIKQITDTLGQNYQFNLPSTFALPTLYETRRLDQTGGGYQDNRQIVITLNANNAVDGQAAVAQIVDALNGPSRFGTTPRLY